MLGDTFVLKPRFVVVLIFRPRFKDTAVGFKMRLYIKKKNVQMLKYVGIHNSLEITGNNLNHDMFISGVL